MKKIEKKTSASVKNTTGEKKKVKVNKKLLTVASVLVLMAVLVTVIVVLCKCSKKDDEYVEIPVERTTYIHGEYEYVILDSGTVKIVGYTENDKGAEELIIPTAIEGKFVSAIDDMVFAEITAKSVVLGVFVESIGDGAFYRARQLESVTLPARLKTIGSGAFAACDALAELKDMIKKKS